jgi:hypothetical protein
MLLGDVDLLPALGGLFGLSVLAFFVSGGVSVAYRWYFREPIPRGLAALFGVATVALYLNTVGLLGRVIGTPGGDPFDAVGIGIDLLTLLSAFVATIPGRRLGDSLRSGVLSAAGAREVNASVGRALRGVARLSAVELPASDEIEDMASYDPVPAAVKDELGGKTLLFPRAGTETLRERLVTRLKEDYNVGYVDAAGMASDESLRSIANTAMAARAEYDDEAPSDVDAMFEDAESDSGLDPEKVESMTVFGTAAEDPTAESGTSAVILSASYTEDELVSAMEDSEAELSEGTYGDTTVYSYESGADYENAEGVVAVLGDGEFALGDADGDPLLRMRFPAADS